MVPLAWLIVLAVPAVSLLMVTTFPEEPVTAKLPTTNAVVQVLVMVQGWPGVLPRVVQRAPVADEFPKYSVPPDAPITTAPTWFPEMVLPFEYAPVFVNNTVAFSIL